MRSGLLFFLLVSGLASCSPGRPAAPLALDETFDAAFVRKALLADDGSVVVLLETPLFTRGDDAGPKRALELLARDGGRTRVAESTRERPLLDVARHPSGELTLLFASSEGFTLARLDAEGVPLAETLVVDPSIATDPPIRAG